jgi:cellulose synthase/poly-beta-1,6-N-acetylglucosamine synthase-like glycosyltransferase
MNERRGRRSPFRGRASGAGRAPAQAGGRAPLYSVVIPHYQQPDLLERCPESLIAQKNAPPFEVIVVDNASKEMPTAVCARFPEVRLLLETIKGPGPARNMGVREARSPVVVFLDSDSVADPDWLAIVHRTVTARPDCGIFCVDVRILPVDPKAMNAVECYEELFAHRCELMIKKFNFAPTANLAVRKDLFEAIGPFISGLLISEDVEWGQRARTQGHEIAFVPDMQIATPARETWADVKRRWDRQVGQQHAEMVHRPLGKLRFLAKTLAMPVSPLAELPGVLRSPRLPGLREKMLAMVCLTQTRLWRTWRMIQLLVGAVEDEWLAGAWRRTPATPTSP